MRFDLKVAVAGSGRAKSFKFDRVHLLNCGMLSNNMMGDLPFVAERRWNRDVSSSDAEVPSEGAGRALVMLPCSSGEHLFELLRERSMKHLRCCDCMATCKFSGEGQGGDTLCMLHCALPLSVFHVFAVLTGEPLFSAKLRPAQCIHPKATPQGGLEEKDPRNSSDLLFDSVARRLSSTSNGDTDDEDSLLLPPVEEFRILVVDDNLLMRKIITAQLTQLGFANIAVAVSGEEAVDICSKREVDLVLLDYQMPFMSGKAVCRALRQQEEAGAKKRVIVMHSASFIEYQDVLRMGADSFMEKPFSVHKLRTLLRRHVALAQS